MELDQTEDYNIEEKLSSYSQEFQEDEKEKVTYKSPKIKDLFPTNYYEQKIMFFDKNKSINPHFVYSTVVAPQIRQLHTDYQSLAQKILINNIFQHQHLTILNQSQVLQGVQEYLSKIGLEDYVQVKFQPDCLSRTSVVYYKSRIVLKIRTPLSYDKVSLQGVLNHQVGTHIVRYLNHKENSARKPDQKAKRFQEGLAAINQLLPEQRPYLFKAALRYMASIQASKTDFVGLYKFLSKYLKNTDDCFRQTVRAKRGMSNTDKTGGYYKDQNYLIGAVQILTNRKQIDFQKCFYSKLSAQDSKNLSCGVLPPFLDTEQKKKHYLKKIQAIAICNFIN